MIVIVIIFCVLGLAFFTGGEVALQRAAKQRLSANKILDEAAAAYDASNQLYMAVFKVRGQRDLEKLAELACGVEEDTVQ